MDIHDATLDELKREISNRLSNDSKQSLRKHVLFTDGPCGHRVEHPIDIHMSDGGFWIEPEQGYGHEWDENWIVFFVVKPNGTIQVEHYWRKEDEDDALTDRKPDVVVQLITPEIYRAIERGRAARYQAQLDVTKAKIARGEV